MFHLKRRDRSSNGERYRRNRNRFFKPLRFEPLEDRRLLAIVPELTYIETEVDNVNGVDGLNGLFDIVVSPDGKHVYTAGTLEDGLAAFARDGITGELTFIEALFDNTGGINGLDAVRSVAISPDGKHVYTAGLLDSAVATFSRNATTGKLTFVEVDLDIGALVGLAGASGVTVSPDGKHVYVAARTDDALSAYERDATTGALTFIESEFDGIGGVNGLLDAERLAISPDGKHVYVAAEGDNAVSVFSRDAMTGAVTFVEAQIDGVGGVDGLQAATSVAVSPDGAHVYVSSGLNLSPLDEDWLATFSRNTTTGALTFINHISSTDPLPCTPDAAVFSDTVVTVSPDGKTVYATKGGALVQFSRNTSTGALTVADAVCTSLDPGGLFDELLNPTSVAVSPDGSQAYVGDLVGFLSAFHTQSRVFVVNSIGNGADANLADGICDDGAGNCTLRAAIGQANASSNLVGRTDRIEFDIPGPGPHTISPMTALPTITEAVVIDGTSEPDFAGTPVIELNGTSAGAGVSGLTITAGGSTVKGLAINRFTGSGIKLDGGSGNTLAGNFVGTNAAGTTALANTFYGIVITNSAGNQIGGTTMAAGNVISKNRYGIVIQGGGSTGNIVEGNRIGTNAAGTAALGNLIDGVIINQGAHGNTIGGTTAGAGNLISGNVKHGVSISTNNNNLQGNRIGTNAAGTMPLANGSSGVFVSAASGNQIGTAGAGNQISGNSQHGVVLSTGASTNSVLGNLIGTDATGAVGLGNGSYGVLLITNSASNQIGGTTMAAGNVISKNRYGIVISGGGSTGNMVEGNRIGTNSAGTAALGNLIDGVIINHGAHGNTIGGTAAGAGNVIAHNGLRGVVVTGVGIRNAVQRNSIHSNASIGIDLKEDGVTANDVGDGDSGANNVQNYPVLTSAVSSGGNTTITGTLNSTASSSFTIEFYSSPTADPSGFGEGQTFLGSTVVNTDGFGNGNFAPVFAVLVSSGHVVSATATDANGNTSEFSAAATVSMALLAAGGPSPASAASPASLTTSQLQPIVAAALARLSSQGLTSQQTARLSSITFAIADLPGTTLGMATPHHITLDVNAAGYGWYLDPTPQDDSEFSSGSRRSPLDSQSRMDLLTAVMHEFAHTLGLADIHDDVADYDLMLETLATGIRRTTLPQAVDAALTNE